ncbi:MAG TPA: HEAT repeat domain-containing protein [Cyclobacteriaceae bacterium]|nr:HEAT repeat domain-containing protein [Cyclobacteriaceae bacterium]
MSETKIQELIKKHNEGVATAEEKMELERLLEAGLIQLEDIGETKLLHEVINLSVPSPSSSLDEGFYKMLSEAKADQKTTSPVKDVFMFPQMLFRVAAALLLLLTGIGIGHYFLPASSNDNQVEHLTQEISDLKEMMMLSLLEKDEATERLKAVSLSEDMNSASSAVTEALVKTLNNDSNVNVRLAALEALKPYVNNSGIREQLVRSISKQESPLVQVTLAELMAAIQEKKSVSELEKIIQDKNTPEDVRKKIQETINVMI